MEIRTTYHRKMREIQNDLLLMGSMVEKAIHLSVNALKERDIDLANRIIADDKKVDTKRFEIEDKCIQLIAYLKKRSRVWKMQDLYVFEKRMVMFCIMQLIPHLTVLKYYQ